MITSKSTQSIERRGLSILRKPPIHVAVATVVNSKGNILISRRREGVHLEGLWEFPGGKLEQGETILTALKRELLEEVGIQVDSGRQLIKVIHQYPEKTVKLDTWLIKNWSGVAKGLEGQEIRWAGLNELQNFEFPEADQPIISALNLPSVYQISPEPGHDLEAFLTKLEFCLENGTELFQLQATELSPSSIGQLTQSIKPLCAKYQARYLVNGDPSNKDMFNADGIHLSSERLLSLKTNPYSDDFLIGASCHNIKELEHAELIGVDFVVLSPVAKTLSHPNIKPLGLKEFERMIEGINIPVYALGGMSHEDLESIWEHGGQGVAMTRAGWPG